MLTESRLILENITAETGSSYAYSDKKKGAGYHKNGDGIHTIHYAVNSFLGDIIVQGTLEQYPSNTAASFTVTQTFVVTSVANPGTPPPNNIYQIDGVNYPVLNLVRGGVYTFDQSDASNVNHQIAFKDSTGASYTTNVVTTGTLGQPGAKTVLTIANNAPSNLRYYCVSHGNGMGNTINVTGNDPDADWVDVVTFAGDSTLYNQPNNDDRVDYDFSQTFTGKFVWIRVKYKLENGTIREIRYNY